jgi:alanine racemase
VKYASNHKFGYSNNRMMHENRSLYSLPNIHIKRDAILSQCMDLQAMIMVDITQIDCKEGVEVIVFNTQEMIQHIAEIILYETLTVISPRIKKILKK